MKRFRQFLVALIVLLVSSPASATSRSEGQLDLDARFDSPTLGRSIRASVYLPARYSDTRHAEQRFPVLYLLHGLGDDHTAWPRLGKIKPTIDRMIHEGALRPIIIIMPDAGKSWYVNDARADGNGAVFDAFRTDLLNQVDARLRTVPCAQGRAIGGLSMGGYGALLLGTTQPKRFSVVFSLSGAVFSENLSDDPQRRAWLGSLFHGVHGEPISDRRLRDWNIFTRLGAIASNAKLPSVWLSAGDDDSFPSIVTGSVRAFDILRRRGAAAELRIDDAGHTWSYWQKSIQPALQWMSPRLKPAC